MQLSHTLPVVSATFDDPNLVSTGGLVPLMSLAQDAGLHALGDEHLSLPTDKGANAGAKLAALVAGMAAGADSIEDMGLLRHGAMGKLFERPYAPSTLGSFLRTFTFGHVRQGDAVASRFTLALAGRTGLLGRAGDTGTVLLDLDDTIVEVHGYAKQGAGFGYSGVRGLNALLATVSTEQTAPVIAAQRLRKGSVGSSRGAARLATDALALVQQPPGRQAGAPARRFRVLLCRPGGRRRQGRWAGLDHGAAGPGGQARHRRDRRGRVDHDQVHRRDLRPGHRQVGLAGRGRRDRLHRVHLGQEVRAGHWPAGGAPRPGPEPRAKDGQESMFDPWCFHAFFTTTPATERDTVATGQVHRGHAVIENVHADLKASALAHLPSGKFAANAAWLIAAVMAFNLTRAAATLTGSTQLARATTPTIRRKLVNLPARVASSARRLHLHLPRDWPWEHAWTVLYDALRPGRAAAPA